MLVVVPDGPSRVRRSAAPACSPGSSCPPSASGSRHRPRPGESERGAGASSDQIADQWVASLMTPSAKAFGDWYTSAAHPPTEARVGRWRPWSREIPTSAIPRHRPSPRRRGRRPGRSPRHLRGTASPGPCRRRPEGCPRNGLAAVHDRGGQNGVGQRPADGRIIRRGQAVHLIAGLDWGLGTRTAAARAAAERAENVTDALPHPSRRSAPTSRGR